KDLHPALQYLLLEAMREVHWAPGPFNRLGEFPSEQPNDLPLSPTAEAFYRSGPSFWQRYTSFWLTSLLTRIVFFVIPVVAALVPVIGFAPRLYRWLYVRRINQLHRALGILERELAHTADRSRLGEYQARLAEIESAVRLFKVARPFEIDLHRLRIHLRMVQEDVSRMAAVNRWCSPAVPKPRALVRYASAASDRHRPDGSRHVRSAPQPDMGALASISPLSAKTAQAGFAQASSKCLHQMRGILGGSSAEIADHRHRWLLRARHERPRSRRAADERDELAPRNHSITSSARASSVS